MRFVRLGGQTGEPELGFLSQMASPWRHPEPRHGAAADRELKAVKIRQERKSVNIQVGRH
jgi:hypothetical protein